MPRITAPATIEASPTSSRPLLEAVQKQLGSVPNLFRTMGVSTATLEGYLGLSGALGKGALDARTRTRLALVVAERNGCSYCLSAHTYLGLNLATLDAAELRSNRDAASSDPAAAAALVFARQVVEKRGHVTPADLEAVRKAGFSDAQVLEIIAHVALNTLTNYINVVADTAIDFPEVKATALPTSSSAAR
jgi:uncharacterized peroxidase-related enzyme